MPPTAGVISFVDATDDTINLTVSPPSGGADPYTQQWHRDTVADFTPGAGNLLAGATGLTLADADPALEDGTAYWYKVVFTDAAAATATAYSVMGTLWPAERVIGFLGDSRYNPAGVSPSPTERIATYLERMGRRRKVTGVNRAVAGSTVDSWQKTSLAGLYGPAVAAFQAAGVTDLDICLGVNNSIPGTNTYATPSLFLDLLKQLLADLAVDLPGVRVKVHYTYGTIPGSASFVEHSNVLVATFNGYIDQVVDGVRVLRGDTDAPEFFGEHPELYDDGIHLTNPDGWDAQALLRARSWDRDFSRTSGAAEDDTTVSLAPGTSGWDVYFQVESNGLLYDGTDFVVPDSSNFPSTGNGMTEGTGGVYSGPWPTSLPPGTYGLIFRRQLTPGAGNRADTDKVVTTDRFNWDGRTLGPVTVGQYAAGRDPASYLTTQGYTSGRAAALDRLDSAVSDVPASVWSSVIEPAVDGGQAVTAKQAVAGIGSALAGKLSGEGTDTLTFYAMGNPTVPRIVAPIGPTGRQTTLTLP